ncbi:head-tail connector protein [Psychrobacillus psychrodurans]|uniref:head-tail connector protein n=1 Tax=Psychrobacillus psychrodurans TaxID=126157 RepID=UPI003CFE23E1
MMLEVIKKALRISSSAFDGEVTDLIESAKLDLKIAGITVSDSPDALIKRAITIYCKAHFGYDNPEADRFRDSYVMLKQHLSLAGDYREPVV